MNIFIDTSIFYGKHFNFQSIVFDAVINNAIENKMHILTTDLQHKEVNKKINDKVDNNFSADKSLQKARDLNITDDLKTSWRKIESDIKIHKTNIIAQYLESYEKFLSQSGAQTLNTSEVDNMNVFESFFNKEAPFSQKKPEEFRDAFMLKRVQQYARDNQEEVYIVSEDKDMKSFCANEELLVSYHSLELLLNDTIKDWELHLQIDKNFDKLYDNLIELIDSDEFQDTMSEKVSAIDIEPDYFELLHGGTIHTVSIEKVIAGYDHNLIDIHEESFEKDEPLTANIDINVHLDINFFITEPDRDTVRRDPDTKEFIFIHDRDLEWTQTINLPIVFAITAEKENDELALKNLSIEEVAFEDIGYIDSDEANSPY